MQELKFHGTNVKQLLLKIILTVGTDRKIFSRGADICISVHFFVYILIVCFLLIVKLLGPKN